MNRDEAIAAIAGMGETVRTALRLGISVEDAANRTLESADLRTDDPYEIVVRVRDAARALVG